MANEIVVNVALSDKDARKVLQLLEDDAKKKGQDIGDSLASGIEKSLFKIGAIVGSALAFKSIIHEASEAQSALNLFNNSLALSGHFTQDASNHFVEYAKHLQETTTFSDDLIVKNAAVLASLGKLSGEGLDKATKAALDFASSGLVGTEQAFQMLGKAAEGNIAMFNRYGIKIDETLPKHERLAAVVDALNKKFGGLSEAQVNTFSGAMAQLTNTFKDFQEVVGTVIIKSPVLIAIIKFLSSEIGKVTNSFEAMSKSKDVIGDIIKSVIQFSIAANDFIIKPLEFCYNAFKFFANFVAGAVQEFIIIPLTNIGLAAAKVGAFFGQVNDDTVQTFTDMRDASVQALDDINQATMDSAGTLTEFPATTAVQGFLNKLNEAAIAAPPLVEGISTTIKNGQADLLDHTVTVGQAFSDTMKGMGNAAREMADKGSENFKKIGATMFTSIGNGAGQAFAAFGKAVAKGENAIQAFLNSLIASMGQMAIQLGSMFILQGLAYLWAGLPNGPSLIAAGAALAAIGGVLSAVGGGGGSGGGSGGGGGGTDATAGGPNSQSDVASPNNIERQNPGTVVNLNVHGNVLDRRQTGLELADVLRENFDTNAVSIGGVA